MRLEFNDSSNILVFRKLHKVGNVGRSGIILFQVKFYFDVLRSIVTYQFFPPKSIINIIKETKEKR